MMRLEILPERFAVCKVKELPSFLPPFSFLARTDEEISLVCPVKDAPKETLAREDGWRGLRIQGVLDFSLVGILARIAGILAEKGIPIFALSTYNTDYILVKEEYLSAAREALLAAGYEMQ